MTGDERAQTILIGYARVSTDKQDIQAQLDGLARLGVEPTNIYLDEGLSAASRPNRIGLGKAMVAVRAGDQFVVTRLDRLARDARDAHNIAFELEQKNVILNISGVPYDPSDLIGKMMFSILAMFAEFEAGIIQQRTREGMARAREKGRLKGKKPKLSPKQDAAVARMYGSGENSIAELQELFGGLSRSSIYRALERHRIAAAVKDSPEGNDS